MEKDARIFVTGTATFIGSALLRRLEQLGYGNIVGRPDTEPDLADGSQVEAFFANNGPEYVFLVSGDSGGIAANQTRPASMMLDNLLVECHVIHSAYRHGVKKLLYLASSCCYPKECPQPMKVEHLFTGPLEPTNAAYGTAKLAGLKLCEAYRQQHGVNFLVGIPANIFGPEDDFSLEESHVIPALIRRLCEGKQMGTESIEVWGTGKPQREFLFVDDLADACVFVMREYDGVEPINIGGGTTVSVGELAELVKEIVGYHGNLAFDPSKPDGMPFKALDSSELLNLGWQPTTSLPNALQATYDWYRSS